MKCFRVKEVMKMGKKNKYKKSWGNFESKKADDKLIIIMDSYEADEEPKGCVNNDREEYKYMKRPTIKNIEVVWALGFKVMR